MAVVIIANPLREAQLEIQRLRNEVLALRGENAQLRAERQGVLATQSTSAAAVTRVEVLPASVVPATAVQVVEPTVQPVIADGPRVELLPPGAVRGQRAERSTTQVVASAPRREGVRPTMFLMAADTPVIEAAAAMTPDAPAARPAASHTVDRAALSSVAQPPAATPARTNAWVEPLDDAAARFSMLELD